MDKEIKNREDLVENLLRELPLHDASDEVVSELLEKVEATPIEVPFESSRKKRFAEIRNALLASVWATVCSASALLRRPRYASIAVAACSLLLVLTHSMNSHQSHMLARKLRPLANVGNHLGKQAASEQGTGARDAYGDLIVSFKNDIETAKNERAEIYNELQRVIADSGEPNVGSRRENQAPAAEGNALPQAPTDYDAEEVFSDDEVDSAADRSKADIQGSKRWRALEEAKRMGPGAPWGGSFSSAGSDRRYAKQAPAKKQKEELLAEVDSASESPVLSGVTGGYRNDGRGESPQDLEYKKFEEIDERSKLQATIALSSSQMIVTEKYNLAYAGSASSMQSSSSDSVSQFGGREAFARETAKRTDKSRANKESLSERKPERITGKKSDIRQNSYPARRQLSPAAPEPLSDVTRGQAATEFLKRFEQLDGLRFKEASGYWSNTYIPGSTSVRHLEAALKEYPATSLRLPDPTRYAHDLAHQTYQPFDAPRNSALAVYLHSNHTGAQEKQRMIVQVGLKASERRSGQRPAMNVAVVLDLRKLPSKEVLEDMSSMLFALNKQKDIGDRFSLTIAGREGGTLIPADTFGHGHLSVAFKNLASAPIEAKGGWDLSEAMAAAQKEVSRSDDPTAPLGSSLILLVTASSLEQLGTLGDQAHAAALEGITTSVVGIGDEVHPGGLEHLALKGQGRRRILNAANDAKSIIVKELNAVSQVVARAVRLRIRLAPGVQLIDVLGSKRLDAPSAERVRQAEKSIDQRISKNLGIAADRGEDEEGIQIVIPAFYAGDAHVVLLDVVAPGPGAISDVQVRYKDLVFMKNGVARANLSLTRSEAALGPLEQNVLKNLLAYSLSEKLKYAAQKVISSKLDQARSILTEQRALLRSFQETVPGFERDRGIRNDILMIERYLQSIGGPLDEFSVRPIAFSLQYAGTQRVLPELFIE